MAKFKPGIPESFSLNVDPVRDLGDYLDEPAPVVPRKPKDDAVTKAIASDAATQPTATRPVADPQRPVQQPAAAQRDVVQKQPPTGPASSPVAPTPEPSTCTEAEREERGVKPKAPRREISMTPDTLRMSDELLDLIRSGSGQRDTKANELFHALVLLVYEVKDELDPHTIPKRGRWGTPTARAYPLELKNAFLRALLEKYGAGSEPLSGLKYPVNSAA
jgi:hypothetical protein